MRAKERETSSLLERAIALAVEAHEGQRNAAGEPYVLHPLRVMLGIDGEIERTVAVLHDTVENCADRVTLDRLRREGYPDEIVDAVDRLTRRDGESYDAFVERIVPSALARRVKLADLADNLDVRRLSSANPEDVAGLQDRLRAWNRLRSLER